MTTKHTEAKWREINSLDEDDLDWEHMIPARFKNTCSKPQEQIRKPDSEYWY